ncbi:unnamed protein product [Polarella glacialis]|uniref:ABC1 atypical kinase-like domain-containing protein n=1 Tax=Polarella glacialis TaxID=89957 RepID=A0A813ERS4_POLGL|nr:unnamed protein product [Polarella glacialis]
MSIALPKMDVRAPDQYGMQDRYGKQELTAGRAAVAQLEEIVISTIGAGVAFFSWLPGVPCRLLGKEAVALVADTAVFAVSGLPPVLLGRAADLSRALLQVRAGPVLRDPKGAVAQAAHTTLDLLGGGFVKVAQVVAHSPALFPEPFVRACRSSLANASTPPAPLSIVSCIIAEDLGVASLEDVFSSFQSTPMASASIAQVHAATLRSGEPCVVKARLIDLFFGKDLVLKFVSAPLEACVDELRRAIMDECDLGLERHNIEAFDAWLRGSPALRQAKLNTSVRVPRTFPHASATRVLTMERINGLPLSEVCAPGAQCRIEAWQDGLTSALSVAALSIIDGPALFHADLHSGNMIVVPNASGVCDHIAFIDFGCCGNLPPALRDTLLMQASAFAGNRPDVRQFCRGFGHALKRLPGLGPEDLDTDALAEDLKPLLRELQRLNPFRPGSDPLSPELNLTLFRLQAMLCRHGVQVPREFTLLLKTGCFGALYFSLLDDRHKSRLISQLLLAGAAYCASHPRDARQLLSPASIAALLRVLRNSDGSVLASVMHMPYLENVTALRAVSVTAGIPIVYWVAVNYLAWSASVL